MRRREVITLLGGAASAWPLAARAQQPGRLLTIGFQALSTPSLETQRVGAFAQRLRERGWIEGRTVAIEYRWAEGRSDRSAEIAAEFVRLKVDVMVVIGTPSTIAAKQAISAIPIVFVAAADPVGTGLVASLGRPGGNVTGLSFQGTDTAGKRLELLREVVPALRRASIMGNAENPNTALEMREVEAAARTLGLDVTTHEILKVEDIGSTFTAIEGHADALYVCTDPLMIANRTRIASFALAARLPTIHTARDFAEAGGLMTHGPNFLDLHRRAADFVDKILRGTKPADIPVEQPTRFDLVINQITAKAIGLKIPETFLVRADEVIE
jgi:putative tryptophan/tyrosine transport system substrate-binding protein